MPTKNGLFVYLILKEAPTYRGSHQIDVGDFFLKYVKIKK